MKTFFKIMLLLLLAGYLCYSFIQMGNTKDEARCSQLKVTITDTQKAGFITQAEVERLLNAAGVNPIGKPMDSINGIAIEQQLMTNPYVKKATFYKMPGGKANVIVEQRLPVMRIMPEKGKSYYIDERGEAMKPLHYNADLIVATGHIDSATLHNGLIEMALFLRANPFWNDQITQIHVQPNQEVDLATRVGSNIIIHFGSTDSIPRKFTNLKAFYEKVMPEVGWNTYKEISLEYNHQIVCRKRRG